MAETVAIRRTKRRENKKSTRNRQRTLDGQMGGLYNLNRQHGADGEREMAVKITVDTEMFFLIATVAIEAKFSDVEKRPSFAKKAKSLGELDSLFEANQRDLYLLDEWIEALEPDQNGYRQRLGADRYRQRLEAARRQHNALIFAAAKGETT